MVQRPLCLATTLLAAMVFVFAPARLVAQTKAHAGNKLAWSQPADGLDLKAVQTDYIYVYRVNGVMGTNLSNVTCSGTVSPFSCRADLPSTLKTGPVSLTLVAIDRSLNPQLESGESVPLTFEFRARPGTPFGLEVAP